MRTMLMIAAITYAAPASAQEKTSKKSRRGAIFVNLFRAKGERPSFRAVTTPETER